MLKIKTGYLLGLLTAKIYNLLGNSELKIAKVNMQRTFQNQKCLTL